MSELATLIRLQEYDSRIARLDAEVARLPQQLRAIQSSVEEVRQAVETAKARLENARKEMRARERDLDDIGVKRTKSEARLYEVKTNVEYSAVLAEIETIKAQKARTEEEILALMERQEALAGEIREAERRLAAREAEARGEEAAVREKLAAVEAELAGVRAERAALAAELPQVVLGEYEKILRARGGLAVAPVTTGSFCGGCRVTIRPQALQEIRSRAALVHCESCGRFLYWPETPA